MKKHPLIFLAIILLTVNLCSAADNGYFSTKWSYQSDGAVIYLEITDLDGDSKDEIVSGTSQQMFTGAAGWITILDKDKEIIGEYFLPGYVTEMQVADIEGDGEKEIIASVFSRVHVVDRFGVKKWDVSPRYGYDISAIKIDDIDSDGQQEILVGAGPSSSSMRNRLFVLNCAGKVLWDVGVSGQVNAIETGDLDGDGRKEIFVGCYGRWGTYTTPSALMAFNSTGEHRLTYTTKRGVASIAVADLEDDGSPEILVGSYEDLFVLNSNGVDIWKYTTGGLIRSIHVADIDADDEKDIVIGSNNIFALDSTGDKKWENSAGPETYKSVLFDLNKDGKYETIAACSDAAYVIDPAGDTLWSYKVSTVRSVAVGDAEGDGYFEVAVGASDKKAYLFQSQTYAKTQEAYDAYQKAKLDHAQKKCESALAAAEESASLYFEVGDDSGKSEAEKLIEKIEKEVALVNEEKNAASQYYNLSRNSYAQGEYIDAATYAEKAKYKYSYLKDSDAVSGCDDLIGKSTQFLEYEASELLDNASNLSMKAEYSSALPLALKSMEEYEYLSDPEGRRNTETILAETYLGLASEKRKDRDFANASDYVQRAYYMYSCLGSDAEVCDPSDAGLNDISEFCAEIGSMDFEEGTYSKELKEIKQLASDIEHQNSGSVLAGLINAIGSNIKTILLIGGIILFVVLFFGGVFLGVRKYKKRKENQPREHVPPAREDTEVSPGAIRLEPIRTEERELAPLRKDDLKGYGATLKQSKIDPSWDDEL